ncbi:lysM and putative peptidoglycan-binding domain-containing protein 1-like isoform X2 [Vombatus ursinus]|uniref:lysM and putative peptidoglycan-binding domain-containing protein 1-like isoform X2 n=1 Tax=Vombatus ursinus TaxID=29139 RepID=UPI000FFD1446|nr:lysM and putative peptidoglycan-binding domain-containing protein 1-like isoform X2 [Vombatus ursinus]XP_027717552.1 lysM and putative peptidoglycan-binding domain-containing protein 1-like isoform X2 [Vombatus ursinus]XP_027717562.1 lysM and putative peptidoglycan-binding domain-containing protein 1-like isoform X2 [Vombatus ursinus]XP_027717563.1 lysM and putative peptidoglycan-binding domain-containing protein 1-like isoform X2 [Vombatus ursinus]
MLYEFKMEQIKRANRLYTNDSIFLKKTLYIPILTEPRGLFNGLDSEEEEDKEEGMPLSRGGAEGPSALRKKQEEKANGEGLSSRCGQDLPVPSHDLSATDFLKKIDSQISLSKKAAVRKLKKGETGVPGEDLHPHLASPRKQQRAVLGPVPLTRTTRAATLRDQEDEIFKL